MKDWPRISVITPSYQQALFLQETLRSVLTQDYPNLEYIVIDGGSTDGSVEIIKKHENQLSFWVSEKDRGAADAIRKGFERATGAIMAYLNSDDVYLPGTLKAVAEVFIQDPSCDLVFGDSYWIDTESRVLAERRQTPFSAKRYLYGGADIPQPSTFWKREMYLKAGGINPEFHFAFDMDLFCRFISLSARFKHVKRFLSSARIHSEAKSSTLHDTYDKELAKIRSAHLPYPVRSLYGRFTRNLGRIQRTCWYLIQGDLFWLLNRIPDRLRADEPVGPRTRWK